MQPNEVGRGNGYSQQKTTTPRNVAESIGKASKKGKGCTPIVIVSHPMAKDRAEIGAALAGNRGVKATRGTPVKAAATRGTAVRAADGTPAVAVNRRAARGIEC